MINKRFFKTKDEVEVTFELEAPKRHPRLKLSPIFRLATGSHDESRQIRHLQIQNPPAKRW